MMNKKLKIIKTFIFSLFFIFPKFAFADDSWVLASMGFTYPQSVERSEAEKAFALNLPQLVMEQIATGITRYTPADEILDRKYVSLLTERQSLLLQLSKEIKVRDQIVISNSNPKKIKKIILEEEKKISEIQKSIDENLETVRVLEEEHVYRTQTEKKFNILTFLSGKSVEEEKITGKNEQVVFYKNSSSALYEPSGEALEFGLESKTFESAVLKEKINGLVTGEIKTYGNYASVTCSLIVYPGAKVNAVVTEVGAIDRPIDIARNIAYKLVPQIINNLPISIYFEIMPAEIRDKCRITIDDVVHNGSENSIIVNSGFHTVSVECEGYVSKSITYNFINSEKFLISVPMQENQFSNINLCLVNPVGGNFYNNGILTGSVKNGTPNVALTVNGQPVIGQFMDLSGKGFFFYISESLQENLVEDESFYVKAKIQDNAELIEKRRIWTYRGYSAVVISIPFTLYTAGKVNSMYNAYSTGVSIDESSFKLWQNLEYAAFGVTGACTGFFVYELVRYLVTASSVLPQNVKKADSKILEKAQNDSLLIIDSQADFDTEPKEENLNNKEMENTDDI